MVIEAVNEDDIACSVLTHKEGGSSIKDEKGINFPDSNIDIQAITERDREILPHICNYANIIGISFAQTPKDIQDLIDQLERLGKKGEIAIVAKIETKKGVENLPQILEALIEYGNSGVMIARGDLAIEIGFENLAYMQEEILDLCTAAHMPVILATQVLESKMKTNIPSRAEISDVAFAHKAECVMLNKGEYALETIRTLNTILKQMDLIFRKNKLLYNHSFQWK
jgi:pyruvate kinase